MKKQDLNLFDVVKWKLPHEDQKRTWVVTVHSLGGRGGIRLSDSIPDFRSQEALDSKSYEPWVVIDSVGDNKFAAVDVRKIFEEGVILNTSFKSDDDDDYEEMDHE